jgi:hypothetical protein
VHTVLLPLHFYSCLLISERAKKLVKPLESNHQFFTTTALQAMLRARHSTGRIIKRRRKQKLSYYGNSKTNTTKEIAISR